MSKNSKFILKIPDSTIRINAVLRDVNSKIQAFIPLAYSDYISINDVFVMVFKDIISNAIKTLQVNQSIVFESSKVSLFLEKNIKDVNTDIILSALLIASIEKTILIQDYLKLNSNAKFTLEKFNNISHKMSILSPNISTNIDKFFDIHGVLTVKTNNIDCKIDKTISQNEILKLIDVLSFNSEKNIKDISSDMIIGASLDYSVAYYRKLFELKDLTWIDVKDLTLPNFIKVEK